MFEDVKKSLGSILYERTTSPFYGTLIVSWVLWNWRIVYLTFFISEETIQIDKITYITDNYSNIHHLVTFPIFSTIILLTVIPFISNGAYWLNLKFENWKKEQKNQIERKQLLTLEQSIELREQLISQESRFEKLLEDKNLEIKQLKEIVEQSDSRGSTQVKNEPKKKNQQNINDIYNKIKNDEKLSGEFDHMVELIQSGYKITDRSDVSAKLITLLDVNELIIPKGSGVYSISDSGRELIRLLLR